MGEDAKIAWATNSDNRMGETKKNRQKYMNRRTNLVLKKETEFLGHILTVDSIKSYRNKKKNH